ncbi:hypothetical protein ACFOKI_02355 [Sphingomonas qilianensis]|uniref:Response regulator n=1 Tax=Sphingomonas qilianensis TaxID=1736690 RepID=A0ABU9XST0_9SPHN
MPEHSLAGRHILVVEDEYLLAEELQQQAAHPTNWIHVSEF